MHPILPLTHYPKAPRRMLDFHSKESRGGRWYPLYPLGILLEVFVMSRHYQKVSEWPEYKMRLHPVAYDQLRVLKFHTQRSFNDLINFLIRESLESQETKQKLMSMYRDRVSDHWIIDWRDGL